MNWKLLMLILLPIVYGYRLLLNIVTARSADNPTPENVADVFDGPTYRRWKRYCAEKCSHGMISTTVTYVVMLVLLCLDVHASVASLFPAGTFWQLFGVLLFQTVLDALIGAGFNYADTMVLEQKYGFNRSTMKTFVVDQIRDMTLELVISLGLVYILSLIHNWLGDWVILLFAGVLFVFTLLVSFLYPIFSRMGNKFVPLEEGELKDKLMALLTKHGYQVKAIEVMDASRRTTKLNAYFTGFGKMKTIVLYDNLVNTMSTDEICAVFAHELGHGLHKDVLKQQVMNLGNLLLMALVIWLTVRAPEMHEAFGFNGVNYGFAYLLSGILLGLVQPLTGMAMSAYSRFAEYRADRQAVEEGYGPALVTALKLLAKENFSHLAPSPLQVVLEYSHPPLSQRISAIEAAAQPAQETEAPEAEPVQTEE